MALERRDEGEGSGKALQIPRFSASQARTIVCDYFGLKAVGQKDLPSYSDQNFRVDLASGERFVLKIANSGSDQAMLDLENRALERAVAAGLPCARLFLTIAGEKMARVPGKSGQTHWVRLLTYLPGRPMGTIPQQSNALLRHLGQTLAHLDQAFEPLQDPVANRYFIWDLRQAADLRRHLDCVKDPRKKALVAGILDRFVSHVTPVLNTLPMGLIHNDGNEYNILVGDNPHEVAGVIDFGDLIYSHRVGEVAVGAAYAMLGKKDPLQAAVQVVAGYHQVWPLSEAALSILLELMQARLVASVVMAAYMTTLTPDNEYLTISSKPAWKVLFQLDKLPEGFGGMFFRQACGLEPCSQSQSVVHWLQENGDRIAGVLEPGLGEPDKLVFQFDPGGAHSQVDSDQVEAFSEYVEKQMDLAGATIGVGRYNEPRDLYKAESFQGSDGSANRSIHLGIDLFSRAGTPVFAPLAGTVHSFADNNSHLNYGPTIILHHRFGSVSFFTLYGHLERASLEGIQEGQSIAQGQLIGRFGTERENGGWPPHLHFQLIVDMLGRKGDFDGVASREDRAVFLSLCPDPNLVLQMPEPCSLPAPRSPEVLLRNRGRSLGRNLSLAYGTPLKIVRGSKQFLYDENGGAYLDLVNNVCHVGHCHPRVVEAAAQQMALLNTNTRYLHDHIVNYAERLLATFPDPLNVCFFVCSGSEANDLALRMALNYTKQTGSVVVDGAYHGHTNALIGLSPYKYDGPGGKGAPASTRKVVMPDGYRGPFTYDDPHAGEKYGETVKQAVADLAASEYGVAAFFCESMLGCGGQIVLPPHYLERAFHHVRDGGGLCIADEVQVGFGRPGSHFWAFESQGVVPDIVTLGKPMGNGHPIAAVITTEAIADAFHNGMEYFNTYGGNPVSCAVGMAVLDVIRDEGLQEKARILGDQLKTLLNTLWEDHALIGDVRGKGLFLGVDLVKDRDTLEPAAEEASQIIEAMKNRGILLSTDGPLHNVLKIKPPMVVTEEDVMRTVETLDQVLKNYS